MPHDYVLIDQCADIDLDKFIYQLESENPDSSPDHPNIVSLSIRYPDNQNERTGRLYLKTPRLKLGNLTQYQGQHYLELDLSDSHPAVTEFKSFVNMIDLYHITQIEANQKLWNYGGQVPMTIFEDHYLPSLKKSGRTYDECLIVKYEPELSHVYFFDQDDQQIDSSRLQPGNTVRVILELFGLTKSRDFFHTIWNLVQVKAKIPEPEIEDNNSSDVSD